MEIKGRVGFSGPMNDGEIVFGGRYNWLGAQLVSGLGGDFFEHLLRGEMFIYSTAATGIAGAVAGTSSAPMIWNPSDSGKMFIPLRCLYGAVSGTVIVAHIAFGIKTNCGAQIGTAAPIVSLTEVAPVNALIGSAKTSKMRFAPATCSLTGAPTYLGNNGMSAGGAMAAGPLFETSIDLTQGVLAFPPGTAFFPYISNAALALVASVTVVGLEVPYANLP